MARTLKAPLGVTSLFIAGVNYDVGPDGYVDVSEAHEQGLVDTGFLREDRAAPEAPEVPEAPWVPPVKGK